MTTQSSAEIEIVRRVYDGINRGDISAVLALFDPSIVRVEPEGFPMSGTYRGHEAIGEHFSKARATWAEGACTPERFEVSGEKVIAFVHVHVRLKDRTDWIDGRIADGFVVRNGKVTEMHTFTNREKALEWSRARS